HPLPENPSMTQPSVEERVIKIVSDNLGQPAEKIKRETSFVNDLGADSLDVVELVMEFEDQFEISIPDEDASKIQTVGNAIDSLASKAQKAFGPAFLAPAPPSRPHASSRDPRPRHGQPSRVGRRDLVRADAPRRERRRADHALRHVPAGGEVRRLRRLGSAEVL